MDSLGRTRRWGLVALVAVLVMFAGATGAYAGSGDYGSATGRQKSWSGEGKSKGDQSKSGDESQSSDRESSDESDSSDSSSRSGDQNGNQSHKDCQKNEVQSGEQGQSQGESEAVSGGEEGNKGKKSEQPHKQKQGEQGHVKEKGGGARSPSETPSAPTTVPSTPAVVPTQAPAAVAPVQTQQSPSQGGEVQGETQKTPSGNQGGGGTGNRLLASTQRTQVAAASQTSGLASTGFDAWLVGLLGVGCVAGAGLLLSRTRRS